MLVTHPPAELATYKIWHRGSSCARGKEAGRSKPVDQAMMPWQAAPYWSPLLPYSSPADGFLAREHKKTVHFPSPEGNGAGPPGTMLTGMSSGRRPASFGGR